MTRRRPGRAALLDDRGSSLMELMVGMLIMMIFLGMFTGAIVLLYQSSNRANALTASAGQTDQAFARLDKTIRYAYSVSTPGTTTTGWYVEFLTTATGVSTCTQLRVTSATPPSGTTPRQLQARTWTPGNLTAATAWVPWASGITNGGAAVGSTNPPVPFVLSTNGTNVAYEQLTVNLVSTSGSPPLYAQTNATFTAVNSAATVKAAGTSGTVAVCNDAGARP